MAYYRKLSRSWNPGVPEAAFRLMAGQPEPGAGQMAFCCYGRATSRALMGATL